MQTTGAEWKQFIEDDPFWKDKWLEEWQLEINGKTHSSEDGSDIDLTEIPSDTKIKIIYGYIVDNSDPTVLELVKFFKRWKKVQTVVHLVVEAPKEKIEAIKKAVKSAGGKVL